MMTTSCTVAAPSAERTSSALTIESSPRLCPPRMRSAGSPRGTDPRARRFPTRGRRGTHARVPPVTEGAPGSTVGIAVETGTEPRCAVHPARPAVDQCPVCGRPRCGADARSAPGGGCLACGGVDETTQRPPDRQSEAARIIAGTLTAILLAELLAPVVSEYVGAKWFAEITPFLLGLACATAATAAARTHGRGRLDPVMRAIGGVAAVLGTVFAFRLVTGGQDPFGPAGTVLPPYGFALAGAAVSYLVR